MSMTRRAVAIAAISLGAVVSLPGLVQAGDADAAWSALREGGVIAILRHARAPGTGDPPGFRLGDCATQRNLSDEGRSAARRLGEAFRQHGVKIAKVQSSAWCRTRDTASEAFGGSDVFPALNSFFADRTDEPEQTEAVRQAVAGWRGPGVLVMVTHQVNITALTGIFPREGEVVVLRPENGSFSVVGRIGPV